MGRVESGKSLKQHTGREYAYWLCCIPGIGNRTIDRLLEYFGTPEEIYRGGEKQWKQFLNERQLEAIVQAYKDFEPAAEYAGLLREGIRFWLREDPEYPAKLRDIPDPPFALFGLGRKVEQNALSVAVIGARDCSEYGRFVADRLGNVLGGCGIQVISGMARGIDGVSQRAALKAGGMSVGVLGSGVDVCYPKENRELYTMLRERGCILSPYPPGTQARSQNFPPRNRIVSGLADVLVVVEARAKSGTLITVDMALEQGRDVYVVPGRVTDRLSDGCNSLLRQGAGVFLTPEDFLQDLESVRQRKGVEQDAAGSRNLSDPPLALRRLPSDLRDMYRALDLQPASLEEIGERLAGKYETKQLASAMMRLCVEGFAGEPAPGYFTRRLS